MKITEALNIKKDAKCSEGHFPGNPIVPGAYLISLVTELSHKHLPKQRVSGIQKAKFSTPLAPGEPATIELEKSTETTLKFKISSNKATIVSGKLQLESRR